MKGIGLLIMKGIGLVSGKLKDRVIDYERNRVTD